MDRQDDHFGHMATRTRVAQQPVNLLLRGSRMQLRQFHLASNYTEEELPRNAYHNYQPPISGRETRCDKVNQAKSAVARPGQRKFLGFSFTGEREPQAAHCPQGHRSL